MAKKLIVENAITGEEIKKDAPIYGTLQKVEYGEKETKLVIKSILGDREEILDLSTLVGGTVLIDLTPVVVSRIDVDDTDEVEGGIFLNAGEQMTLSLGNSEPTLTLHQADGSSVKVPSKTTYFNN
jgi:hypothetical protein